MNSSIIGDAKHQELNMSFTFDEHHQDKLIVNVIANHNPYQLELLSNPDLDFQDFKNALLAKQFKIISMSPETLKLKIAFTSFEFKNIQKMTLNTLNQTIKELSSKLKEQYQKNNFLENEMKQMRKEFDLMTTKMADLSRHNEESKQELIEVRKEMRESNEKNEQQAKKMDTINTQAAEYKKIVEIVQQQLTQVRKSIESQKQIERNLKQKCSQLQEKMKQDKEKILKTVEQFGIELEAEKRLSHQKEKEVDAIKKLIEEKQKINEANAKKLIELSRAFDAQKKLQEDKGKQILQSIQRAESRLEQIQIEQMEIIKKQKEIEMIKLQNSQYKYSAQDKAKSITLDNKNSKAANPIQKLDGEQLALVDGAVFKKGSSIRFKIQVIGRNVAVGMVIRKVVAANSYQLENWQNIGHGCFILLKGGYSYSHSNKEHNYVKTDFEYGVGEVIRVQTDENELLFVNETKKKEQRMKIRLTEEEWKEACFCVLLNQKGDSVSIQ